MLRSGYDRFIGERAPEHGAGYVFIDAEGGNNVHRAGKHQRLPI
ncbi:MAG: hypothetical protein WHX60_13915 [Armatimonadota bacterium]